MERKISKEEYQEIRPALEACRPDFPIFIRLRRTTALALEECVTPDGDIPAIP